jgi:glycosyltransferase involved in cell wall biosynthesis
MSEAPPIERTRLALLTDAWLISGGAEQMLATLVAGLNRDAFEPIVCVLFGGDASEYALQAQASGVKIHLFRMSARRGPLALLEFFRLVGLLRRERVALVHGSADRGLGGLAGLLAGIPVRIYSVHDLEYWRRLGGKVLARFILAHVYTRVVAVSHAAARAVESGCDFPRGRVCVVHNGVGAHEAGGDDPADDDATWAREAGCLIVTVARLVVDKGLGSLMDSMQLVARELPGARLAVVGDGPLRPSLEAQVHSLGLGEVIRFAGARDDVGWWLSKAAVFVLPSVREGLGIAVIEAQAAGVPVVVSDAGGLPEVVTHDVTGLLVPLERMEVGTQVRPEDLAAAVLRLLKDEQLARRLSVAARASHNERFSSALMVRRYEQLYRECLGQSTIANCADGV